MDDLEKVCLRVAFASAAEILPARNRVVCEEALDLLKAVSVRVEGKVSLGQPKPSVLSASRPPIDSGRATGSNTRSLSPARALSSPIASGSAARLSTRTM